jgi:hypothetical protein
LDAFTKTVEDARIRTTSGGVVTIASLLIILFLIWGEWSDYRKIVVQPELIVDKGRGEDCIRSLKTISADTLSQERKWKYTSISPFPEYLANYSLST